jgi:hypothetical protein
MTNGWAEVLIRFFLCFRSEGRLGGRLMSIGARRFWGEIRILRLRVALRSRDVCDLRLP